MLTPEGKKQKNKKKLYWKILLRGESNPRRCIKQDSEPNTLQTELFRPPQDNSICLVSQRIVQLLSYRSKVTTDSSWLNRL